MSASDLHVDLLRDFLQFEGGVLPSHVGQYRAGWTGPWPPPEKMGIAVGRESKRISVWVPEEMAEDARKAAADVLDMQVYERVSYSKLPDDFDCTHLMRGALYRPEKTQE